VITTFLSIEEYLIFNFPIDEDNYFIESHGYAGMGNVTQSIDFSCSKLKFFLFTAGHRLQPGKDYEAKVDRKISSIASPPKANP